ncbi:MAG TPA: VTT domain-containing protein [Myxococcota bacterium]|nr:VTT domain-containing protein [Myxococcota bacterium]
METLLTFLESHAYGVLFLAVLADQTGLPVPAAPFLVAAGAMLREGTVSPWPVFALATSASLMGHTAWYVAGRLRGVAMLRLVCRLSLEPEACVRRSQELFARWGPLSLLMARFVPGLDTMAQPLMGVAGMPPAQYMAWTLAGAILWVGVLVGIGYGFGTANALAHLVSLGKGLVGMLVLSLGAYALWKVFQRARQESELRIARITAGELKGRLDAGEAPVIIDLRPPFELRFNPLTIPGAERMNRAAAEARLAGLAKDSPVVVFCSCPREAGSVRLARTALARGMTEVRPLEGGLDAWIARDYPVVRLDAGPGLRQAH